MSVTVLLMLVGADERRNLVVDRSAVLVPQSATSLVVLQITITFYVHVTVHRDKPLQ